MKKHFVSLLVIALVAVPSATAWTSTSNTLTGSGTFVDYGQPTSSRGSITALAQSTDGLVYGVTCSGNVTDSAHLFVFDPSDNTIADKGEAPGYCSLGLAWGGDDRLYGGGWQSILWSYDPAINSFSSRGQVPGGRRIIALAMGQDGLIYVGTENQSDPPLPGRLLSFDPVTNAFTDLGGVADEWSVGYGLVSSPDGIIYGGTLPNGRFFIYDPTSGVLTDKGQPIPSQRAITSLAIGPNGKIYGGAQPSGRLFSYDPLSGAFRDIGQAVIGQERVPSLVSAGDTIYGGTGNLFGSDLSAHLFKYDIATQSFTDLGIPVEGERNVNSLVVASEREVYGGTGFGGHFFSYQPSPVLTANFTAGAPGSFFSLSGSNFPPNETASVIINGTTLTDTLAIDASGNVAFLLDTSQADSGRYVVTVTSNPSAMASFTLDPSYPLRPQEGTGTILEVPSGLALAKFVYLPLVRR